LTSIEQGGTGSTPAAPEMTSSSASGFGWSQLGSEKTPETPNPALEESQTESWHPDSGDGQVTVSSGKKRLEERRATGKRRILIGVGTAFHVIALIVLIVWLMRPSKPKDAEPEAKNSNTVTTKPQPNNPQPPKPEPKPQPQDGPKPVDPGLLARATVIAGPPRLLVGPPEKSAQGVLFTPDGSRILVGDATGTIRLLNAANGQEIRRFGDQDQKRVLALAMSADGRRFLAAHRDHTLRVWDTDTGAPAGPTITNPDGFAVAMALSPDGRFVVAGGVGTVVRTWDAATGTEVPARQLPHPGKARALAFSADGRLIVSGDSQGKVWLWDAATAKEIVHFEGHAGPVKQVALSRSDNLVVSFSDLDHTLRGWDVASRAARWQAAAHGVRVAFSADGLHALGAGGDQTLKIWDLENGREVRNFPLDGPKVQRVWDVSRDGRSFVSGGSDSLWYWSFRQTAPISPGQRPPVEVAQKGVRQAIFAADGRRLFIWGMDNKVGHCELATRQIQVRFQGQPDAFQVVFLADRRSAVSAGGSRVSLWDVETGQEIRRFDERPGKGPTGIVHLACSPDGRYAVTGGTAADQVVDLWEIGTGKLVRRFELTDTSMNDLAISPDNQRVVVGCNDSALRVWDLMTDTKTKVVLQGVGQVFGVAFSPDGSQLLAGGSDGRLHLWDAATWARIRSFQGHTGPVRALAFSPDGRLILSGGSDKTARLWERETGRQVRLLDEHTNSVSSVGFSPDGRLGLSASIDGQIKIQTLLRTVAAKPPEPSPKPRVPVAKLPVPEADKQDEAEKTIKNLYKDDYAKKSNADRVAFAGKLMDIARDTPDKPVERFVLLREARELASQAADVKLAIKAIDELAVSYAIDSVEMKVAILEKAFGLASTVTGARTIADQYFALAEELLAGDRHEQASGLLAKAAEFARKTPDRNFVNQVEARSKDALKLKEEFEAVKAHAATLKTKPNDPAASLAVGKYYCFTKGDWSKGLPLLAAGEDSALKALAQKELANPDKGPAQVDLANAWWDFAQMQAEPLKQQLLRRAHYWYEFGVMDVTGLAKTQAENRVKELEAMPGFKPLEAPGTSRAFEGHTEAVHCVALSRDGRWAFSGGADQVIRQWDIRTGKETRHFEGQSSAVHSLALSPNGQKMLSGGANGRALFWELEAGRGSYPLSGFVDNPPIDGVAFSPNGQRFLYPAGDRHLYISSPDNPGRFLHSIFLDKWGRVKSLAVSPNSRYVVVGTADGLVYACDVELGVKATQTPESFGRPILGVAWTLDGKHTLACAGKDIVMITTNGKRVRAFKAHSDRVTSIAMAPDGNRFITGSADRILRLWDLNNNQPLMILRGHQGEVTSVAFSADGRHVLSGSADKTVRWWRMPK
jgi:WD40 repeat protein